MTGVAPPLMALPTGRLVRTLFAVLFLLLHTGVRAEDAITIVCFGDSTTAPRDAVQAVYADRLPVLLTELGEAIEVTNAGVGGSHTGRLSDNARHQRPHALDRLDSDVRALSPDIVLIQFGINDSWIDDGEPGGPSRIPLADYARNLGQIAGTLRDDGARVILMTPNKVGGRHESWRAERLARYAGAVRELARAEGFELVDIWDAYEQYERRSGNDRAALMLDGTHPNDQGHALVAELLAEQILKPLRRVDPTPIAVLEARTTAVVGVPRSPECYAQFREGGIIVTNDGTIVVTAQGREAGKWSDRSGQDLVCRMSRDNGATWTEATLIAAHGDYSVCPNALVYHSGTDTIHALYNVFEWDFRDAESRKAMGGRECRQFHTQSDDGGLSWSEPRDITEMLGSDNRVTVLGSGEGIELRHGPHAGRLVVPGGFQKPWGNRAFYSDDNGKTWLVGEPLPRDRTQGLNIRLECKIAERSDGTLVLNARHTPQRARAFSTDGGETWTSAEIDPQLDAVSCNGALICVQDAAGNDVLLCSVPTGPKRTHGTVYASFDGGLTWPVKKILVPEEFAYSNLVQLADGRIGLFYEARNHLDLKLIRFPLAWLTGATDTRTSQESHSD